MWKPFMANSIMALWRRYFSFAVCYEQLLDPNQHYLFADYPHGAFPLSQLLGLTVRHMASWQGVFGWRPAVNSDRRMHSSSSGSSSRHSVCKLAFHGRGVTALWQLLFAVYLATRQMPVMNHGRQQDPSHAYVTVACIWSFTHIFV